MNESEPFVYSGHEVLLVMRFARNYNRFLESLLRRHWAGQGPVVDFGAGVGAFAERVREWSPDLVCVEPDAEQARLLAAQGLAVVPGMAQLADDSIAYVYTLNVLEHIDDDEAALADIFRKLRPGGRLLIYVPALSWLYSSLDRKVGHVRRYHRADLMAKLRRAGFGVTTGEYVDSLGVLATLAFKALGNDEGRIDVKGLTLYDRFGFPVSRLLDVVFKRLGGKNLLVVCEKP